ncbi:calcium uniporter protein 6 [Cucumis melo var. makuwa]|uniref:Calcium uniporter protein 6 n=2 Tax=Cucumis melo TaxID=3656 RepID=A0A5A7V7R9_CUCMM|nr:calcium uniporter protein 6 [Cucumis melo var. makuwa]
MDKSESGGHPGIRSVNEESDNGIGEEAISFGEAKRLMRLVNVGALEKKLGTDGKEVIGYSQ